jgi:hygromycin-B 7''-O-kinase
VIAPPVFESMEAYVARRGDVGFWRPYLADVLERHGLEGGFVPVAGFHPTYPTFLVGDNVVKLFGHLAAWRRSHAAERAAHALVATDPDIAAPRVLAEGRLYDGAEDVDAWPYLVTTLVPGCSWRDAGLSFEQRRRVAADLGRQVRRVHALCPAGAATHEDWAAGDVAAAAERSSLPPHLIAQIDDFLASLAPFDRVFVHGDLCATHAFVEKGRLTGIIDWGDALVTDRHYELIQLHRDLFACDKALLRVFLEACEWPVGHDFPRQALGLALHRQAVGLAQHDGMDVFEPVASLLPLAEIATLDELAIALFAV